MKKLILILITASVLGCGDDQSQYQSYGKLCDIEKMNILAELKYFEANMNMGDYSQELYDLLQQEYYVDNLNYITYSESTDPDTLKCTRTYSAVQHKGTAGPAFWCYYYEVKVDCSTEDVESIFVGNGVRY